MTDLKYVTYCGLYCRLCANLARVPRQASALRETLRKDGWERFGPQLIEGFGGFWDVLAKLSRTEQTCQGCRGGCGDPDCAIRRCARERAIELCPSCPDFPCAHLDRLGKRYPNLIADGMRQRQVGLERWLEEQEERCRTGFCYADLRHPD